MDPWTAVVNQVIRFGSSVCPCRVLTLIFIAKGVSKKKYKKYFIVSFLIRHCRTIRTSSAAKRGTLVAYFILVYQKLRHY